MAEARNPRSHPATERGASMVEYALLLALIAVVCVVAVTTFGSHLGQSYSTTGTSMFGT